MADQKCPPISARVVPPVAGIDLMQSLSYTDSQGLPLEWFYTAFTYPRVFYRKGSRPHLEAFVAGVVPAPKPDLPTVEAVLDAMNRKLPHFVPLGHNGPSDRAWPEEELLESGGGWCNEQARVFIALTQVLGLPSRLVFVSTSEG